MNRSSLGLFVLALLVIGGIMYYGETKREKVEKTFVHPELGFELTYRAPVEEIPVPATTTLGYIPFCFEESAEGCLYYPRQEDQDPHFEGAAVEIHYWGSTTSCAFSLPNGEAMGVTKIAGRDFNVYRGGEAAAGHYELRVVYATPHQEGCLALSRVFHGATPPIEWNGETSEAIPAELVQDIDDTLNEIIMSLRFTQ